MRNLKRALSLALAAVMVIGMMVIGAGAASTKDFTDADEIKNTDAVSTMVALGIINGKEDGSYFDPAGTVTRAEMAKMICVALNEGVDPVLGTKDKPTFSDIKGHWAESYIEFCATAGIIAGRGNGKFDPAGTVTSSEAAKMLLVTLGYNAEFSGLTGNNWAMNTNVEANKAGLYNKLGSLSTTAPMTRDNAAQMIYNTIDSKLVTLDNNAYKTSQYNATVYTPIQSGSETKYVLSVTATGAGKTLTSVDGAMFDSIAEGKAAALAADGTAAYVTDYTFSAISVPVYDRISSIVAKDETFGHKYLSLLTDDSGVLTSVQKDNKGTYSLYLDGDTQAAYTKVADDVSYLMGQKVKVLYKDTKNVYGVYASASTVIAQGVVGDMSDIKNSQVKIDGTVYKTSTTATSTPWVYFNTNAGGTLGSLPTNKAAAIKAVDNNDDGKIDLIVVSPFSVGKVTYVGTTSFNTTAGAGITTDDVVVYDGMAKNDYVMIVAGAYNVDGKDVYTKIDKVVSGEATSTKTDAVMVDGNWYKYGTGVSALTLGNTYDLVIVNGYAVIANETDSSVSVKDYAVVIKAESTAGGLNTHPQAKLLLSDGTVTTVDVKADYSLLANKMVTYTTSKNVYTLTAATGKGFDKVVTGVYKYDSNGKTTYGGDSISDSAVVFLQDKDGDWSVVTGATLKKYGNSAVTSVDNAYANKSSSTGFNTIELACVKTSAKSYGDVKYGYVTGAVSTSKKDNTTVYNITFWNGEKEVVLAADNNVVSQGDLFSYTENNDDTINVTKLVADGTNGTNGTTGDTLGAVAAWNSDTSMIKLTQSDLTTVLPKSYEVTKDTQLLFFNASTKKGVGGDASSIEIVDPVGGYYAPNVIYVVNDSTEEVIFAAFEVNSNLTYGGGVTTLTNPTTAEITAALGTADTVLVTGSATIPTTLAADKTLVVNGDATLSAATTISGTLSVTGDVKGAFKLTVNGTKAVKVGNVTDALDVTGNATVVAGNVTGAVTVNSATADVTIGNAGAAVTLTNGTLSVKNVTGTITVATGKTLTLNGTGAIDTVVSGTINVGATGVLTVSGTTVLAATIQGEVGGQVKIATGATVTATTGIFYKADKSTSLTSLTADKTYTAFEANKFASDEV